MVLKVTPLCLIAAVLIALTLASCRSTRRAPEASPSEAAEEAPSPTVTATPVPLTDAQRQFADAFITAVNAKDLEALRKLVLPEALACYDKDTEPYLELRLKRFKRYAIPADYSVSFVAYSGGVRSVHHLKAPVRPTDVVQIEFRTGGKTIKLPSFVTQEKGAYYLLLPCLTHKGAVLFKTGQEKRAARIEKAREVARSLRDPFRSQLATLIKQGKEREARDLCRQNLHLGRTTAAYLVDLLAGREPE